MTETIVVEEDTADIGEADRAFDVPHNPFNDTCFQIIFNRGIPQALSAQESTAETTKPSERS
jgi:hypothetical protein